MKTIGYNFNFYISTKKKNLQTYLEKKTSNGETNEEIETIQ